MMKNSISKRDWETISAYLDTQLSQKEQARFESRLYNDRQLQVALEDLRRTRQVLRVAPRLSAPRNFLLTPEIAGSPIRIPRLAPVFGWASAVASFLLVLVLVGDFFTGGGLAPVSLITSQESEYIFQHGELSESDVWTPSAVSEEIIVSSKSIANSTEEAAPLEMLAEAAPMDIAADEPVMESTPLEEELLVESQESELQAMELAAVAEETTPENLEGIAAAPVSEFTSETPAETPPDSDGAASDEAQDATASSEQSSLDLTEGDSVAKQAGTEEIQEPPTETVEIEELTAQGMTEDIEQLSATAAETTMIADERMFQAEPPTSDDSQTMIAIEPMPADNLTELESIPVIGTASQSEIDFVLGVEVILAMGALGTGLAWIYTRRRVG